MTKPSLHIRLLLVIVLVVLAATGAYVFTASNTVPNTNAGSGSGTISGYTISGVAYNLNSSNPNNIDSVAFTIAPVTAGTVKIQVVTGGAWYSCTNTAGSVSCDTTAGTQATVAPANQLTVVATT
jgi:hypothetical protein